MKRKDEELLRVKTLINNDRLSFNKDFTTLFSKDLKNLLEEYFVLGDESVVNIEKRGKEFELKIVSNVLSFKTFSSVSKEV